MGIKCFVSSAVALALAFILENGHTWIQDKDDGKASWWEALGDLNPKSVLFIFVLEPIMSSVNKVDAVWLGSLITVVAYGMAAAVKTIPQWTAASIDSKNFEHSTLNVVGVMITFVAAIIYTSQEYVAKKQRQEAART